MICPNCEAERIPLHPSSDDSVCPECGATNAPVNDEPSHDGDTMTDVEADADTLASAGMGTDEDYGYFGGDE